MKATLSIVFACLLLSGCDASPGPRPQVGTESHFLNSCTPDDACGGGLDCIANRCTLNCERDEECASLSSQALCLPNPDQSDGRSCDLEESVADPSASGGAGGHPAGGGSNLGGASQTSAGTSGVGSTGHAGAAGSPTGSVGGAPAAGGGDNGGAASGADTGGGAGTPTAGNGGAPGGGNGGVSGQGASGQNGGGAGTAGSAGGAAYDPCAGKSCGDPCDICDPNDLECGSITLASACDPAGDCVAMVSGLCDGTLWAETDSAQYAADAQGTAVLHNDTAADVFLPGCGDYYYDQLVDSVWTDWGPNVVCDWEGYIRPLRAGDSFESAIGPFTSLEPGTWRVRFTVGHGCLEGVPMSEAACTSEEEVSTPPFEITAEPECGDPAVMALYGTCMASTDADACAALGGTWGLIGLSTEPSCQCPTGDGECPCTEDADCTATCRAPTGDGGIDDCLGVTAGTCAPGPTVGCWCLFDTAGSASAICID